MSDEKPDRTFVCARLEIWRQKVRVCADSAEEAEARVREGQGQDIEGEFECLAILDDPKKVPPLPTHLTKTKEERG